MFRTALTRQTRLFTTTRVSLKSPVETVKDAAKVVDRKISDAAVKGIEIGGTLCTLSNKSSLNSQNPNPSPSLLPLTLPFNPLPPHSTSYFHTILTPSFIEEVTGKVKEAIPETSGQAKGQAHEVAGQAKGKANELAGEAKGKAKEVKGEVNSKI